MQQFEKPEHNREYFKAFHNAGMRLQKCMDEFGSGRETFRWIRKKTMWPSYDDLVFSYKQSVFSVKILFCKWQIYGDESRMMVDGYACEQQIEVCKENKIIPCVFLVNTDGRPVVASGWNLRYSESFEPVAPEKVASDLPVECSSWEKHNFAIQCACDTLEKQGYEIDSFCDILGVEPQICFHKAGESKHKWCKVINAVGDLTDKQCDELVLATKKRREIQMIRTHPDFDGGCIILFNFMPTGSGKMMRQEGCFIKNVILWM